MTQYGRPYQANSCERGTKALTSTERELLLDGLAHDESVGVDGGLLTLGGTASDPVIGLDPADVVVPGDLADYVTIEDLGNYNSGLTLNGLSDVDVTTSTSGGTATLLNKVAGGSLTNGQYSIDTATNTLTFAKIGSNGGNTEPVYNAATPNTSLVRVQNAAAQGAARKRDVRCGRH